MTAGWNERGRGVDGLVSIRQATAGFDTLASIRRATAVDTLANIRQATAGFDTLASIRRATAVDTLANIRQATAGFDTLASIRQATAGFDTLASIRQATAAFETTAMIRNVMGPALTRNLATSFRSIPVSDLLGVWQEATTLSEETPSTDSVLSRLQVDVPSLPPAVLVGLVMTFVWLVSMAVLSGAAFDDAVVAKEFISLTGLSPAFVSSALAGWSGWAVNRWQSRPDEGDEDA